MSTGECCECGAQQKIACKYCDKESRSLAMLSSERVELAAKGLIDFVAAKYTVSCADDLTCTYMRELALALLQRGVPLEFPPK